MTAPTFRISILGCCLAVIAGCGQSENTSVLTSDNDALLNELLGADADQEAQTAESDAEQLTQERAAGSEDFSTADDTSESILDDILGPDHSTTDSVTTALLGDSALASNDYGASQNSEGLTVGRSFPYSKTIQQTVTRKGNSPSQYFTAVTRLQLALELTVLEASDAGAKLSVRYDRVQYFQDLNGMQQTYDSSVPGSVVVPGIEAYIGMVGNGFQFELTDQNSIQSIQQLDTFLDQCVNTVAAQQRPQIRSALAVRFQKDAVQQLTDESVGLLPFGSATPQPGDVWVVNRQQAGVVPTETQTTCRMIANTNGVVEVGLVGRIEVPTTSASRFSISDGRSMGRCYIDLTTGMPVHCQRSSYMKIVAPDADGQMMQMSKQIETTFTSRTNQGRMIVQQSLLDRVEAPSSSASGATTSPGTFRSGANPELSQTASLPGSKAAYSSPGLNVQPVSSSQGLSESGGTSVTGVPFSELQSTTEAVYPD